MALSADRITDRIMNEVLDFVDSDSFDIPAQMKAFSEGLVAWFRASTFTHPPGKVTGRSGPAPGPALNLKASNGKLIPAPLSVWAAPIQARGTIGPQLSAEIQKHINYFTQNMDIFFEMPNVKGNSTAVPGPPPVPGVLVGGLANNGVFYGISGNNWTDAVIYNDSDKNYSRKVFNAIIAQLRQDLTLTYPPGTINGSFPAPGQSLVAGTAVGGVFS